MAFLTPGRRVNAVPHIAMRAPSGRIIHQPVHLRGDLYSPAPLAPVGPSTAASPALSVAKTQMSIVNNETLRIAPPGPGLPGAYVAPSVLRDTVGRVTGGRLGVPAQSLAPDTSSAAQDLFGRMGTGIPSSPSAAGAGAPGMMPTLTPEQYQDLTGGAGGPGTVPGFVPLPGRDESRCPGLSPLECLWALHQKEILVGALGFVAGIALLRWRAA